VALQTRLSPDLPLILGDKIQLQQVILNLLVNAIEAMSGLQENQREILLSSETINETLAELDKSGRSSTVLPDGQKGHVLVSVYDSGPGLDKESLGRIFEAFYTTKSQGLGMGLAISRSIIEAHGGRLQARSNFPRGAIFAFALPISDAKGSGPAT